MLTEPTERRFSAWRVAGSLWFACVLLMMLLMAMACATVYESAHGSEQAQEMFYRSWWFAMLLALLAVNVLAAVVIRYPFHKRQIGFVLTHGAILVVLLGALLTRYFAVDGRVGLVKGQTIDHFTTKEGVLSLVRNADHQSANVDLRGAAFRGFNVIENPAAPPLSLEGVSAKVIRYLPDSQWAERMANDAPRPHDAVEVSLSADGRNDPTWLFAGQTIRLGAQSVRYRRIPDHGKLMTLLNKKQAAKASRKGEVVVEYDGSTYKMAVEECMKKAAPLGATGLTVRVLRYLPHAVVGPGNKITSASNRPVNPFIEVEIVGPQGREKRKAFARFPDFQSMHKGKMLYPLKLRLMTATTEASMQIEVFSGQNGDLYVRFNPPVEDSSVHKLSPGKAVATPWHGLMFSLLQRFDHARRIRELVPLEHPRETRLPGLLVRLSGRAGSQDVWLQKEQPRTVTVSGSAYVLKYHGKEIPLGFSMTLNDFHIGYYPGGRRPRSFESTISITDPASGDTLKRVISMNHPVKFGGVSLFQSSYDMRPDGAVSYLSVSHDPGTPVVFIGYITMIIGMLTVLGIRMNDRRRMEQSGATAGPANKVAVRGLNPARATATLRDERRGRSSHKANHDGNGRATQRNKRRLGVETSRQ